MTLQNLYKQHIKDILKKFSYTNLNVTIEYTKGKKKYENSYYWIKINNRHTKLLNAEDVIKSDFLILFIALDTIYATLEIILNMLTFKK